MLVGHGIIGRVTPPYILLWVREVYAPGEDVGTQHFHPLGKTATLP